MLYRLLKASFVAGLFLLLTACQTPPQTKAILAQSNLQLDKHQIPNVPFYPQEQFFCGPTTLSEVLNFYGTELSPEDVAPSTFIPGLEGTLQLELVASARQQGLLAYAQRGSLSQLLALVKENIPVIILQNNSISLFPMWHYAVVIGYDIPQQSIILHTGKTKSHRLKLATFERTWQRGNYWLLAAVPSHLSSQYFDQFVYTKAAQDLLSIGQTKAGLQALQQAINQWPSYWLPYFLLANHYLPVKMEAALYWYKLGFEQAESEAQEQVPYLNNFAYALAQTGCKNAANLMIEQALKLAEASGSDLDNLRDTQEQISQSLAVNNTLCY